jgi:hypothetical protein
MDKKNKNAYDKLNVITINRDDYNMILKDRLDFGFDSIYFRYAEAILELSFFKDSEAKRYGIVFDRRIWVETKLSHFYKTLEQLTRAHEEERVDKTDIENTKKVFQDFAKIANDVTGGM